LAACSSGSKAASSSAPTAADSSISTNPVVAPTTARPGPTTTTTRPEYSFDDSVPPPTLLNTGTDYVAITASLGRYSNWMAAHRPDPALATRIVAPGSAILLSFSRDLIRLRDNGKRLIEAVRRPGAYTVISAKSDAVSLRADESIEYHETVNKSGKVTSLSPYPEHTYSRVLIVLVQGNWRLAAFDPELPPVNVQQ
jgi:hypothetical protein